MSLKRTSLPYIQDDGAVVEAFVADTEADKPSGKPVGTRVFTKDSRKEYIADATGEWVGPGEGAHPDLASHQTLGLSPTHSHPYASGGHDHIEDYSAIDHAHGGGGSLSFQEADRATDLALTTSFQTAVSLSLAAGTWLVLGQSSCESTSTTQGMVNIRLRDTTNSATYAIAEIEVDSALPDRQSMSVHAVLVLAGTATIALEGRQSAGVSHLIGPGNLGDTATKVTRMTAVKIA